MSEIFKSFINEFEDKIFIEHFLNFYEIFELAVFQFFLGD